MEDERADVSVMTQGAGMHPEDPISTHFTVGEFFGPAAFPDNVPQAEYRLSMLFAALVLEPVREHIGVPLTINGPFGATRRVASGWRTEPYDGIGAAGLLSDHMVLARQPLAVGAVDIVASRASAEDVFLAFWECWRAKKFEYEPREVLYENRAWIHCGYPIALKNRPELAGHLTDEQRRVRPQRLLPSGQAWIWWEITGNRRRALKTGVEPLEGGKA